MSGDDIAALRSQVVTIVLPRRWWQVRTRRRTVTLEELAIAWTMQEPRQSTSTHLFRKA